MIGYAQTLGGAPLVEAPVLNVWDETNTLCGVEFQFPASCSGAHEKPGQIVRVGTGKGETFLALASAPDPSGRAELLVKRGGKVADCLLETARSDRTLWTTTPFGRGFPLEEAQGRDVLLFAAGTGIAPIRSVLQHIAAHPARFARAILFYGQRHNSEFAYSREHNDWERRGVRVVLCPSGADDAWVGVRGRVQEVARFLRFGGARPTEAVAFLAGMKAMVTDVRTTLAEAGVPPARVHANF